MPPDDHRAGRLNTAEVAQRLGVKPETVYAYVSRGLLRSSRDPNGRGSWFDPSDVARLAARGTRAGTGGGTGPLVRTALTVVRNSRLYYRGRDATRLARTHSFEAVAHWLWSGTLPDEARCTAPPELTTLARTALAGLPEAVRLPDRLQVVTGVAASADPMRFDTDPAAVTTTGSVLLATMVDALPLLGPEPNPAGGYRPLAARLWPRLTAEPATPAALAALNSTLVLLADHDLAASTVAARVAASTRAHPYAVVAAGLAACEGPLHGGATTQAHRLLDAAIRTGDPVGVLSDTLRTEGYVTGFSPGPRRLYPAGDIRARTLLDLLAAMPLPDEVRTAADGLIDAVARRSATPPTIDFALATLVHATRMVPDAGEAIFIVARTAGWIAHAIEEYREPGLRFRFQGSYVGPAPEPA